MASTTVISIVSIADTDAGQDYAADIQSEQHVLYRESDSRVGQLSHASPANSI